jgi:hypothetical protein
MMIRYEHLSEMVRRSPAFGPHLGSQARIADCRGLPMPAGQPVSSQLEISSPIFTSGALILVL